MVSKIPLLLFSPNRLTQEEIDSAVSWAKANYGRQWKKRFLRCECSFPEYARRFHDYPFGGTEWNRRFQIARYVACQTQVKQNRRR